MKKIKIGLVGTGTVAQTYAQVFQSSHLCSLVAVADIREDVAKSFAEPFSAKVFTSYEKLAESGLVDAVIVATPPSTHFPVAKAFMERQIHVLCEKPLCLSRAEALQMISLASEKKIVFTMASKFRYASDVIKAKSIISSGALGEIIQFENYFTCSVDMSKRWNSDKKISGGGVLIDNGTHSVDIIRYILGEIEEVIAVETGKVHDLEVEENVRLLAKTRCGVVAVVDLAWGVDKKIPDFIRIYGTNGVLCVGWRESKYRTYSSSNWVIFGKGYDKLKAFRAKVENFCKAILGKEKLLIDVEDALASVEVIEAAYNSLRQNLWQKVRPFSVAR
ncbi:MAG: Gfo/Idh/MocA family oxidoreductase [Pyrinomonadaceae bacterium]|nr:Gfo/Idh/MocA family oxidoreductase [Pyrinomonadaceae bacterium]MCX7638996.1 Gfo/Idh/MocA family oxidoreductase [Pyrinomonadaceae bacterium]MDW8303784.1 Gfo/Idh/MocA family oxidoreductase [Acidobacteriota bacterium]